jgi:hypothetical protein
LKFCDLLPEYVWPLLFTPLGIVLIVAAKKLYNALEKLMMVLVMLMIFAFITNLVFIRPNLLAVLKGFIPPNRACRRPERHVCAERNHFCFACLFVSIHSAFIEKSE